MIQYFKQAWTLIRQEKLFSSIYIIGTGLSVTIVMIVSIVFYLKIANIYPETHRDRMLTVSMATEKSTKGGYNSSAMLSSHVVETCFKSLKSAEAVTAELLTMAMEEGNFVQPEGSKEQLPVAVRHIDTQFWTVFPFRFVEGKAFTEADFQSGIPTVVMAESLAKRLFGSATEAIGKQLSINFRQFRVCGVVKDAPYVTRKAYAQLWVPYTTYSSQYSFTQSLGFLTVCILAPSASAMEQVYQEATENIQRYNQTLTDLEFTINGQPDRYWQMIFRGLSNGTVDFSGLLFFYGFIFFILLMVPAISLSGMTDSRIERRISEMGVRRAFGAPVHRLMGQIISENFLFTLLGGAVGLLSSYLLILLGRQWITQLGELVSMPPPEGIEVVFTPSMLLNLPVLAIALGICFLLNLLSSLMPAWRYSRREIIHSLNLK